MFGPLGNIFVLLPIRSLAIGGYRLSLKSSTNFLDEAATSTAGGEALGKLQRTAQQADSIVSQSGRIGGTLKHSEAEKLIKGSTEFKTEISYLNSKVVDRGTPGSIRVDVITGPAENPTAVFDYKFGATGLTPARINEIRSHLPNQNIPIYEVRP